ncbi:MAG: cytochrome c peroxidase [Bacteroidota bacterium]
MACGEQFTKEQGYVLSVPAHFPLPEIPADNQLTVERVELGRKLFFDPNLSLDSSVSCASCHLPTLAFADNQAVTPGVHGERGSRNAPSLANVAYHPYFFREGGNPTLEMQILGPLQEPHEMGMKISDLRERLLANPEYVQLAQEAYGREVGAYVLTRAIAAYERTLISGTSSFDAYFQGDSASLPADVLAGWALFSSERLGCANCHGGFDFSNYAMENNGSKAIYIDWGRYRVTSDSADIGKFKVPSLRNVALTAPYMHDGSYADLAQVIEHYNQGGNSHKNQSPHIRPLHLTEVEKAQLLAFLKSLTDNSLADR